MSPRDGRWPLHPEPEPYESLTSWLARLAQVYGLTSTELLRIGLGMSVGSPRDLDWNPPEELLRALRTRTGVPLNRLRRMTLQSYVPWLLDTLDPQDGACLTNYATTYRVLLPGGARPRSQYRNAGPQTYNLPWLLDVEGEGALQVCELCLLTDPVPYYRVYWNLGIMASCPRHRCLLRSRPAGVEPRLTAARMMPDRAPWHLVVVDRLTLQAVATGWVRLADGIQLSAAIYVRFLRSLLQELTGQAGLRPDGARRLTRLWDAAGLPGRFADDRPLPLFERAPATQRRAALRVAGWLLRPWPGRFVAFQPPRPWWPRSYRSLPMVVAEAVHRFQHQDDPEMVSPRRAHGRPGGCSRCPRLDPHRQVRSGSLARGGAGAACPP